MLEFAVVEVTDQCNLKCKHCYDVFTGSHSISRQEEDLIIKNLQSVFCKRVTLSGGEPLIVGKNLFTFAQRLKEKDMKVVVVTNGTLVNSFAADLFDVFEYVQISLDGPKSIHETIRGKGTFDRAIDACKYLRQAGIDVSFQMTINKINQYYFDEVVDIANSVGALVSVERISHTGRAHEFDNIDYNNYKNILHTVIEKKMQTSDPMVNALICSKYNIVLDKHSIRGCTAGRGGIGISANLDVFPCVRMRHPLGNLRSESMGDILKHPIYSQLGDRYALQGKCGLCKYKFVCGGCRAAAWLTTGHYTATDCACLVNS